MARGELRVEAARLRTALTSCPSAEVSLRLAETLTELGRYEQARTLLDAKAPPELEPRRQRALEELARLDQPAPRSLGAMAPMLDRFDAARRAWRAGDARVAERMYLEAWSLWHPNGAALAGAAQAATERGDTERGRRLWDRAVSELERETDSPARPHLPRLPSDWSGSIPDWSGDLLHVVLRPHLPQSRGPVQIFDVQALRLSQDYRGNFQAAARGRWLAMFDGDAGRLRLHHLASGIVVRQVQLLPPVDPQVAERAIDWEDDSDERTVALDLTDGADVLVGRHDGTLEVWRDGPRPVRSWQAHPRWLWNVTALADDTVLTRCEGELAVWTLSGGQLRKRWTQVAQSDVLAESRRVALTHADGSVAVFSLAQREPLLELPSRTGRRTAHLLRDGRLVVQEHPDSGPKSLRVMDIDSAREVRRLADAVFVEELDAGRVVITDAFGRNYRVLTIDSGELQPVDPARFGGFPRSVIRRWRRSHDGRLFAANAGSEVRLAPVSGDPSVQAMSVDPRLAAVGVAVTHDGSMVGIVSETGRLLLLDLPSGRTRFATTPTPTSCGAHPLVGAMSFSRDGSLVAAACDEGIALWESRDGRFVKRMTQAGLPQHGVTLSADGRYAVAPPSPFIHEGRPSLWDVSAGRLLSGDFDPRRRDLLCRTNCFQLDQNPRQVIQAALPAGDAPDLALSPDGGILAWTKSTRDGEVARIADVRRRSPLRSFPLAWEHDHPPSMFRLALSSSGKWLAAANFPFGPLTLWRTQSGARAALWSGRVEDLAFIGDGFLVAIRASGDVVLYRCRDGLELASISFISDGGAVVEQEHRVELLESPSAALRCRVGHYLMPFEACGGGTRGAGLVAEAVRSP